MGNKEIKNIIRKISWRAEWSGYFPLLEISTSQRIYFNGLKNVFDKSFNSLLVIYKKGVASGYLSEKEYQRLGKYFGKRMAKIADAKEIANDFIRLADKINEIINLSPKKFLESLEPNRRLYEDYGAHNVAIKMAVDVAGDDMDRRVREILAKSRRYSEDFYKNNAKAFNRAIGLIKKQTGYFEKDVFMMTREEMVEYLRNKRMPSQKSLRSRYACSGIYSNRKTQEFLSANDVGDIEKYWTRNNDNILKGVSAYPGKIKGKCRVVLNYKMFR